MQIHPVNIEPPNGIECSYGLAGNPTPDDVPNILIVSFSGSYPDGSHGNAHGHFIASSTMFGIAHFEPWCVVIDFRDMEYRWGNTLLTVFQQIDQYMPSDDDGPAFPVLVVTSAKSRDAFLTLVTPAGGSAPDWHFDNINDALENAVIRANEWIDA